MSYTWILRILVVISMLPPSILDWRTRWIDDRSWILFVIPYIYVINGYIGGIVGFMDILEGPVITLIVILSSIAMSRRGAVLGGADYIMLLLLSIPSFSFRPTLAGRDIYIPGIVHILLLSSLIGVSYVLTKCIWINRARFRDAGFRDGLKYLYTYETHEYDEDREIIVEDLGDLKIVTPGIPMVTVTFASLIILMFIDLLL